jgi:syntaxin 16
MAFRSLTNVYVLMRNNEVARRSIFHDNQVINRFKSFRLTFLNSYSLKVKISLKKIPCSFFFKYSDDRTALVVDLEKGNAKLLSATPSTNCPPDWSNDVDEIQFEMTKIKNKLKELNSLHDKHLNRPTLDDNFEEERSIDLLTQEITQMANQSQLKIRRLSSRVNTGQCSQSDKRLIKNVVNNLALQLQELTQNFRKNQNAYLKSKIFFHRKLNGSLYQYMIFFLYYK